MYAADDEDEEEGEENGEEEGEEYEEYEEYEEEDEEYEEASGEGGSIDEEAQEGADIYNRAGAGYDDEVEAGDGESRKFGLSSARMSDLRDEGEQNQSRLLYDEKGSKHLSVGSAGGEGGEGQVKVRMGIVELLLSYGAHPLIPSKDNKTPFDLLWNISDRKNMAEIALQYTPKCPVLPPLVPPPSSVNCCSFCKERFGLFNKRRICRVCQRAICSKNPNCSAKQPIPLLIFGITTPQILCTLCASVHSLFVDERTVNSLYGCSPPEDTHRKKKSSHKRTLYTLIVEAAQKSNRE